MALQGDLASFALPDVLRLLAGTGKTGRLAVASRTGSGEIWVLDGELVGGTATTSPHAERPADVVFELLRGEGGSFVFDDGEQLVEGGERSSVADALQAAEALVAEWAEVEAVVPSMDASVTFAPEIDGDEVTLAADQWAVLAALGAGTSVRGLGAQLEVTDLVASRRVKDLVERGLVVLGEPIAETADVDVESYEVSFDEPFDHGDATPLAGGHVRDLALLSAEDGPVVLESRDDALLPEPLPGEGTSFAGELHASGAVDGRSDDAAAAVDPTFDAEPAPSSWGGHEPFGGPTDAAAAPGWDAPSFDAPSFDAPPAEATYASPVAEAEGEHVAEAGEHDGEGAADADGDDRGSLLKFLSSVKP
ncbi:MAG TPA: DUF4388 domain-containing protein [Aquihabitans sp.]|jgi:hypothetical protein|nr:DUF4388 domain-containing protein [Aquihabitans sp.]